MKKRFVTLDGITTRERQRNGSYRVSAYSFGVPIGIKLHIEYKFFVGKDERSLLFRQRSDIFVKFLNRFRARLPNVVERICCIYSRSESSCYNE